jgi:hypothetical protein
VITLLQSRMKGKGYEQPKSDIDCSFSLSLISVLDGVGGQSPRLGRFTPEKDPVPIV